MWLYATHSTLCFQIRLGFWQLPYQKLQVGNADNRHTSVGKDDCENGGTSQTISLEFVSCFRVGRSILGWLGSWGRPGESFHEILLYCQCQLYYLLPLVKWISFWQFRKGESIMAVRGVIILMHSTAALHWKSQTDTLSVSWKKRYKNLAVWLDQICDWFDILSFQWTYPLVMEWFN